MSHPQALGQCPPLAARPWHPPDRYADTAGAAARVAEMNDPRVAALAPPRAAELYGLNLLAEDISDADSNMTRFVVLARGGQPPVGDGPRMTT